MGKQDDDSGVNIASPKMNMSIGMTPSGELREMLFSVSTHYCVQKIIYETISVLMLTYCMKVYICYISFTSCYIQLHIFSIPQSTQSVCMRE